ncbi:hypothetical protein ACIXQ0_15555 [Bacteroides fragilis]
MTNTNKKAQDEIKKLREDIKVIGENKDINNSVAQIKEPLKNLARLMAIDFLMILGRAVQSGKRILIITVRLIYSKLGSR